MGDSPPQTSKTPIVHIFGAWGPQQGGAAAPGGGANLAKCPFFGKTSRENPKSKKRSKKEGSKTVLEMISAKLRAFCIPNDTESAKFWKNDFWVSFLVSPWKIWVFGSSQVGMADLA